MARKTSNQTIEKIEKQIDHLKDETYVVDDITPILDSEVLKKNRETTSSPKKKTTTKKVSSSSSTKKSSSTTKKSTTTKKTTSTTTRKKTTTPRDEIVVAPTKKTTKKTTTTKNVRDKVVVADKPTRTRKTKKTTTKEIEDSIKTKNETLQENVEKIVDAIKEDNLDQEIANISLEEFEEVGTEVPLEVDNLEKEIEAIVQGDKEEKKEEILKDSTFIDEDKKIVLDDEIDFPFEIKKEKKEEETLPEEKLEDTVEILHTGETTELDQTVEKIQEEEIEVLHNGETEDLDSVVKVTHYDDYDLEHLDQLDEYDIVGEFEKDILDETPSKKEEKSVSKKPIFPRIKKKKSISEPSTDSYQDLENDLRSLYDRVNDVVEDFDPNAREDDFIDLTKLKSQTEVKTSPKKKFSFQTLKKNLLLKKDAFVQKIKSLKKKKKPVREIEILDEEYKAKKVRKDFEKLSKPRLEKRKKVRAYETEEYDNFSILDFISQKVLNIIMIILSIIFILMCIAFVLFVIYVSTF